MNDGPLDMRMDMSSPLTAEYIVNNYDPEDLEGVIKEYGEERWAKRIAQFIVEHRQETPIKSTVE